MWLLSQAEKWVCLGILEIMGFRHFHALTLELLRIPWSTWRGSWAGGDTEAWMCLPQHMSPLKTVFKFFSKPRYWVLLLKKPPVVPCPTHASGKTED